MADTIETFFTELGSGNQPPLPARCHGTIRFDLTGDGKVEHWYVVLDDAGISVSGSDRPAEMVVRGARTLFERIVHGEIGIVAAAFAGQIQIEGRWDLLAVFRRYCATPPGAHDPRQPAGRRSP